VSTVSVGRLAALKRQDTDSAIAEEIAQTEVLDTDKGVSKA